MTLVYNGIQVKVLFVPDIRWDHKCDEVGGHIIFDRVYVTVHGTVTNTNDDGGTRGPLPNER